ncbi:hypothetical protein HOL34_02880 [bacterium]|jgi:hypothetical protein|nr:hypothetical protein [bacterium]MBT3903404.1 hypothetical protein [bacterium]MBT4577599.1 hypothetical protein [bacterium]MBT5345759.1 hypothetical protein [bacterium]MBT6130900.1 hypothetical protein [bacterium]
MRSSYFLAGLLLLSCWANAGRVAYLSYSDTKERVSNRLELFMDALFTYKKNNTPENFLCMQRAYNKLDCCVLRQGCSGDLKTEDLFERHVEMAKQLLHAQYEEADYCSEIVVERQSGLG